MIVAEQTPRGAHRRGPRPATVVLALLGAALVGFVVVLSSVAVVSDLQHAAGAPVGADGSIEVTQTGRQFVYLTSFGGSGAALMTDDPAVTIVNPSGQEIALSAPADRSTTTGGAGSYRAIGEFSAPSVGTYGITSAGEQISAETAGTSVAVTPLDFGGFGSRVLFMGAKVLVPGTLLAIAVAFAAVVSLSRLVDRHTSSRPTVARP